MNKLVGILAIFLVLFSPIILHAQSGGTAPGFGDDITDAVPIDGGLSLLVAAGIGYSAKKIGKRNKQYSIKTGK